MSNPLITKYRPNSFNQVIGNNTAVAALEKAVKSESRPKTYLLTGPSGVGKTTLARIIGNSVGATIQEVNAATNSGVDDTRTLVANTQWKPVDGKPMMIIIDECHALSKPGWSPLLKLTEEPPEYIYIALATTEPDKIPATIKTRAYPVVLRSLSNNEISEFLEVIASLESFSVTDDVFNAIIQAAGGSPRRALTILQAGHSVQTRNELAKIVYEVESESEPAIEICKLLLKGITSWERIQPLLKEIDFQDQVIDSCVRYITNAITQSTADQGSKLAILDALLTSPGYDQKARFVWAIGKLLFGS